MRTPFPALPLLATALALSVTACGDGKGSKSSSGPTIDVVTPASGTVGTQVTIDGNRFGGDQGAGQVFFGGVPAATIVAWSDDVIVASVPAGAYPGNREITIETGGGDLSDAAAFQVVLPRAFYVNTDHVAEPNEIAGFSVSSTNSVAPLPGSPWVQSANGPGYGGYGGTAALHEGTRRVFTTAADRVFASDIDPQTGVLTTSGVLVLPAAEFPSEVTVDATGTRVFVAAYQQSRIFVADVGSDGTLTEIGASPFPAGSGAGITGIELSLDGTRLYANNEELGEVRGFSVAANGDLTELDGSPYALADASFSVERAPGSDRFYAAVSSSGFIQVFEPLSNGDLAENVSLRTDVEDVLVLAFTEDGTRLFAVTFGSDLHVLDVDPATGELSPSPLPFTIGGVLAANILRASRDGSLVFVKENLEDEIHVLEVLPDGTPGAVSGSPFTLPLDSNGSGIASTF